MVPGEAAKTAWPNLQTSETRGTQPEENNHAVHPKWRRCLCGDASQRHTTRKLDVTRTCQIFNGQLHESPTFEVRRDASTYGPWPILYAPVSPLDVPLPRTWPNCLWVSASLTVQISNRIWIWNESRQYCIRQNSEALIFKKKKKKNSETQTPMVPWWKPAGCAKPLQPTVGNADTSWYNTQKVRKFRLDRRDEDRCLCVKV